MSSCEVRSIIRFLNAKNIRANEIYREITAAYGSVIDESSVCWYQKFNEGRVNLHDVEKISRPTNDLIQSVIEFIKN